MCFKDKFTQPDGLDSEGFSVMIPAGHPLNGSDTYSDPRCYACKPGDVYYGIEEGQIGWRQRPPVSPWAQLEQSHLDIVHSLWSKGLVQPMSECPRSERCANEHDMECACLMTSTTEQVS